MRKVEAFKSLGVTLKNDRWSWAGVRDADGMKVFTAWVGSPNEFRKYADGPLYAYDDTFHRDRSPGMSEWFAFLQDVWNKKEHFKIITIEATDGKKIDDSAKVMPGLWTLAAFEPVGNDSVHFRFEQISNH